MSSSAARRAITMVLALLLACCAAVRADQRWVALGDIHLNPYGQYLDPNAGDTTPDLWHATVKALARHERGADVVVVDGDFLAHHFSSLVRRYAPGKNADDEAIASVSGIARDLAAAFPRAQFVVTLGNNDDPCGDYRSENGGRFAERLAGVWEPLVDRRGAVPDFRNAFAHGGYYAVPLRDGNAVLAMNSVLWSIVYRGSCASARDTGGTPGAELRWLERNLQTGSGRRALAMHIPPGFDPASTSDTGELLAVPFLRPDRNGQLNDIVGRFSGRVGFGIAAHVHRYGFRNVGGVPILVISSISPIYRNFPAFYELRVDNRLNVTSIRPFVYDDATDDFTPRETFDRYFGVRGFTSAGIASIVARISSDRDYRERWMDAYDVWSPRMGDISDHDWRIFSCAALETGGGYYSCTRSLRLQLAPWAAAALLCVVGLGAAVLVRTRLRRLHRPR